MQNEQGTDRIKNSNKEIPLHKSDNFSPVSQTYLVLILDTEFLIFVRIHFLGLRGNSFSRSKRRADHRSSWQAEFRFRNGTRTIGAFHCPVGTLILACSGFNNSFELQLQLSCWELERITDLISLRKPLRIKTWVVLRLRYTFLLKMFDEYYNFRLVIKPRKRMVGCFHWDPRTASRLYCEFPSHACSFQWSISRALHWAR